MALRGKDRVLSADEDESGTDMDAGQKNAPFTQQVAAQQRVRRHSDTQPSKVTVEDDKRPVTDDGGDWERARSSHKDRRRADEQHVNNNQSVNSNHNKKQ